MTAMPITSDAIPDHLLGDGDPTVAAVISAVWDTALGRLDPGERGWVEAIEALRRRVEASFEEIDTGMGGHNPAPIGEICHRRSKDPLWALMLLHLARRLRPAKVLELGTCLGISGAYLAAGLHLNGGARLVTLEGAPALAERARRHFDDLGLDDIDVIPGVFRTTLDGALAGLGTVDLAFIDGHHDEHATQQYFEQILPHLAEGAVVVFDDIAWSDGMKRAWTALRQHPSVRVVVDVRRVGVCVIGGTGPRRQFDLGSLESMGRPRPSDSSDPSERAGDGFLEGLPVARLNLGSGARGEPGWINADLKRGPGVQLVGDVRDGLPISSECLDQIVSIHMLSMVPLPDLRPLLRELRRVLKPGGVLRLGLPDLGKGVAAWQSGDAAYFTVPDADARSLSAKLITQLLWYGHSVSLFTPEFAEELLRDAGFARVHHCRHGESATADAGITELDNRAGESFFVEAVR